MKKGLVFILSCSLLAAACGGSDSSKPAEKKDSGNATGTAPAANASADPPGLLLIGGSDCTTCHRLNKASSGASIGPAYDEVADKFRGNAEFAKWPSAKAEFVINQVKNLENLTDMSKMTAALTT